DRPCYQGKPAESTAMSWSRQPLHPIQPQRAESIRHVPCSPSPCSESLSMLAPGRLTTSSYWGAYPNRTPRPTFFPAGPKVRAGSGPLPVLRDDHAVLPEGEIVRPDHRLFGTVGKPAPEHLPLFLRGETPWTLGPRGVDPVDQRRL